MSSRLCPSFLCRSEKHHHPTHCLNLFVPLVDLTAAAGPTEFVPGTHNDANFAATLPGVMASARDSQQVKDRMFHCRLSPPVSPPVFTARLHRPLLCSTRGRWLRPSRQAQPCSSTSVFSTAVLPTGLELPARCSTSLTPRHGTATCTCSRLPSRCWPGPVRDQRNLLRRCLSLRARLPHPKLVPFPAVLQTGGRGKALPFLASAAVLP